MGDYERQHLQPLFVEREAMNKLFFETERDGFYDTYYENPRGADCAMIGLLGTAKTTTWQSAVQSGCWPAGT